MIHEYVYHNDRWFTPFTITFRLLVLKKVLLLFPIIAYVKFWTWAQAPKIILGRSFVYTVIYISQESSIVVNFTIFIAASWADFLLKDELNPPPFRLSTRMINFIVQFRSNLLSSFRKWFFSLQFWRRKSNMKYKFTKDVRQLITKVHSVFVRWYNNQLSKYLKR